MDHLISKILDYCQQNSIRKLLIIIDKTVSECYPFPWEKLRPNIVYYLYNVKGNESSKSIEEAIKIWQFLTQHHFSKSDAICNIGGGTISDLGGFIASTYKRGIRFVNIPTTLLAMADAAHGGKNGINLEEIKNGIGTFALPDYVWIDKKFLKTLPQNELLNGFAEVFKCALIANHTLWQEIKTIKNINYHSIQPEWINFAITFKQKLVAQDPHDKGIRHLLNFGHTLGHAYETFFLKQNRPIPHGFCVAYGIVDAAQISTYYNLISYKEYKEIYTFVHQFYSFPTLNYHEKEEIYKICQHDKKNRDEKILFVLLKGIGKAIYNYEVTLNHLKQILDQTQNLN